MCGWPCLCNFYCKSKFRCRFIQKIHTIHKKVNILIYLSEGNRICSLLCEASPQTGVQNDGNWQLFHLKQKGNRLIIYYVQYKGLLILVTKVVFIFFINCTFVYVRWQAANKDLARVAFHALSILVWEAVWGAKACETLVSSLVVRETVLHWKERGVA